MIQKKIPLLALAALVGLGAAYLILWVEPRRDYLVELDFRRLAAMAERIDRQLATYRQVVANAANATKRPETLPPPLELRTLRPASKSSSAEAAISIREDIAPGGPWFLFSAANLQAGVRIEDVIQEAVEPNAFDKLVLATSEGRILYQEGRKMDIQLTTLEGLGIKEKTIPQISRSTGLYNATLSGRSYKVFVQPCSSPRTGLPGDKGEGWVLFALMGSPRFHVRALQVSANWIILILGIALLALLSLPFLKLLTIGKGARLRAIDGLLAGLCALIGLSVLTVLLLDGFVNVTKLETNEEEQLRVLAVKMSHEIQADMQKALAHLTVLREQAARMERDTTQSDEARKALSTHTNFFLVDQSGNQFFKWEQSGQMAQRIPVGDRSYFRDALAERHTFSREDAGRLRGYTVESIRSWTTGKDQVAIATLEQRGKNRCVAALTTRMPAVHGAVLPPGFGFAVIDATGKVLFHSERRRMLQENFLDEAESEKLAALAAAGRAGPEKVTYKGRRHRVYLEPIPGPEWSVVTFREMTLLRATNVQIVTTALVCLVLYAALFLALFSAVYMASSTRARWLWPVASRQGAYLQLAVFYAGCLLVHVKLLTDGDPVFLLANGMLIPLLVLFISYIKVRSDTRIDPKQIGALAGTLALLAISLAIGLPRINPANRGLILASLILGGLLLFLPVVTRLFGRWRPAPVQTIYLCTAALLLMVLTILPAASFFKLACDVPLENMLKAGQLELMRQLRQDRQLSPYGSVFFGTEKKAPEAPSKEAQEPHAPHFKRLLDFQEWIFPVYSEHSRGLARLSPDSADGWSWHWEHRKGELWLHHNAEAGKKAMHLVSHFYSVKPQGLDWLGLGAGVLALGLISLGLVWLMSHNLMLLGTGSPLWLDRRKLSLGTSVTHLVYVSSRPERLRIPRRPYIETIDLAAAQEEVETGRILKRLAASAKRLVIVHGFEHRLDDRGFNWAKLTLLESLVGHGGRRVILLSNQDPYLCLSAGQLSGGGDDPEREQEEQQRWHRLLARFAMVDLDGRAKDATRLAQKIQRTKKRLLADHRRKHSQKPQRASKGLSLLTDRLGRLPWRFHVDGCLRVVQEECSPTSRLQEIGIELLPDLHFAATSRGEILHEILTRAERYYSDLWNSLPGDEKLVLLQLADEGLTNPRDLRPLQRLIARGLVRRDPAPRLMNETFRLFVFAAAATEKVHEIEAQHEQESTWGRLKVPLTATLLAGIFFFGITQQEVLKTTLSLMTVVAGALPHLLQLVGYLGTTKAPLPPVR